MMLKFRDLVNPNVLYDEDMKGFQGDSEYVREDGRLMFGSWTFTDVYGTEDIKDDDWTLDSEIDEEMLYNSEIQHYLVVNEKGVLCEIKLDYRRNQ